MSMQKVKMKVFIAGILLGVLLSTTLGFTLQTKAIQVALTSLNIYNNNVKSGTLTVFKYQNDTYIPWSKVAPFLKESATLGDKDIKFSSVVRNFDGRVVVDGNEQPAAYNDGTANLPSLILYRSTVYTPINYIVKSMGKPMQYKSTDKKYYVGNLPQGQFLSDMLMPYREDIDKVKYDVVGNLVGKTYNRVNQVLAYSFKECEIAYNLDGNYKRLTGLVGIDDSKQYAGENAVVQIYGDDTLLGSYQLVRYQDPKEFDLDMSGVLKLRIVFLQVQGYSSMVDFANLRIQ